MKKIDMNEPIICRSCKNEIDPEVCHCGELYKYHNPYSLGHNFVPMGCVCGCQLPTNKFVGLSSLRH